MDFGVENGWLAAFVVGALGGVHCLGMCGGIVAALSLGIEVPDRRRQWGVLLGYNLGRIASYTLAGVIVGLLGMLTLGFSGIPMLRLGFQLVAAAVMVALGLYLGGWWFGVAKIEKAGARWWRHLEPYGRRLIPVRTVGSAVTVGAIWGWLPCGLVYSVLIWSLSSADPVRGATLMLAFGLGTLPNLMLMGAFAAGMRRFIQTPWVRQVAGLLVIGLGLWQAHLALR